ncbi:hypothetical protein GUY44_07520 [Pimelobacter simplex]|uniref:Uncharacterized protein n=1 Tax=Nocardioides simplex TaxID=2045 RepID=A0A0A1DKC2_NOCSI|nr:hypothetical protein [Pimelobacter simplex]AIY15825.1 hypothetical protein KR76_01855 [Pimelobacter simplex]MCG8150323.1 hypothetical protein [Pimelobacter simplex]
MNHCAECCFGTGVEADMDCPQHGIPVTASTDLDDTLANIRARAEAATPGPWDIWLGADWVILAPDGNREIARVPEPCGENAVFIAHARADIELLLTLLDQVTTQRDEIQANRDALARKVAEQRAVIARVRDWLAAHPTTHDVRQTEGYWRAQQDLRAALDGADTTTADGSEA